MSSSTSKSRPGFLLLYVSIVLAFVLIIVMLSVPHFSFLRRHVARTELESIKNFITYVSRVATATGTDQPITIDTTHHSLTGAGRIHRLPRGVQFGVLTNVKGPPGNPTTAVTDPVTFPDHTPVCYAQGTVNAGTLYLVDTTGRLYALSSSVSPATALRMYYYDGNWKRCV